MSAATELRIVLQSERTRYVALPCDVISISPPHTHEIILNSHSAAELQLPSGAYLIRITLPDGSRIERQISFEGTDVAQVTMEVPDVLGTAALLLDAPRPSRLRPAAPGPWVRLLSGGVAVPWQPTYVAATDSRILFGLSGSSQRQQSLQIGGGGLQTRTVSLPSGPQVHIAITYRTEDADRTPATVSVQGASSAAQAIMGYIAGGRVDLAERIAAVVPEDESREDDDFALARCYLALRIHRQKMLQEIDPYFDWRSPSDWGIVDAWKTLEASPSNDQRLSRAQAARNLLQAAEGIPRYTEGLRLLRMGLQLLASDKQTADATDVAAALNRVSRLAQRCDWNQPTTTVLDTEPNLGAGPFALPEQFSYLLPTNADSHWLQPFLAVAPVGSARPDFGLAAHDDRVAVRRPATRWHLSTSDGQDSIYIRVRTQYSDAPLEISVDHEGLVVTSQGASVGRTWTRLDVDASGEIGTTLRNRLLMVANRDPDGDQQ